MPDIEHGPTPSRTTGYEAPPELPPRPVGGFLRKASTQTDSRHEGLWARPVGEAALRLAGAKQAELRARAVSVAPSSSERFLPGLRPGEGTYQSLLQTATPEHVYEQLDVRTRTSPVDSHRDVAPAEPAAEEPHYEFGPQDPATDEPHYEFGPQESGKSRSRTTSSARRKPRTLRSRMADR